jgi:hypothetical protein
MILDGPRFLLPTMRWHMRHPKIVSLRTYGGNDCPYTVSIPSDRPLRRALAARNRIRRTIYELRLISSGLNATTNACTATEFTGISNAATITRATLVGENPKVVECATSVEVVGAAVSLVNHNAHIPHRQLSVRLVWRSIWRKNTFPNWLRVDRRAVRLTEIDGPIWSRRDRAGPEGAA